MGLCPDQNSTTLKMRKSRVAVNPYGMMKSQVTALRRYLSSTDLLTSYSCFVSLKLPKQPADIAPNATSSTAATAATERFLPMPHPLVRVCADSHYCSASREGRTIPERAF